MHIYNNNTFEIEHIKQHKIKLKNGRYLYSCYKCQGA